MRAGDLWQRAKPILLPYDGGASQVYVLDVPIDMKERVRAIFESAVTQIESQCDDAVVLKGIFRNRHDLTLYILEEEGQPFDAELVFWADQVFPQPEDDQACAKAFADIVAVLEQIRALSPSSECVLTASEGGDPRNDRDKPWTMFW